ncbi:MAG: hypothetical protein GC160_28985 [Acidobacteria bacterium]|nr:hypothetical protein [Acidobacteriota bacterium]
MILRIVGIVLYATAAAFAVPVLWTVDIPFGDGGSIAGSFVFDADVGPVIGAFSNIDVTTQGGSTGIGQNREFLAKAADSTLKELVAKYPPRSLQVAPAARQPAQAASKPTAAKEDLKRKAAKKAARKRAGQAAAESKAAAQPAEQPDAASA